MIFFLLKLQRYISFAAHVFPFFAVVPITFWKTHLEKYANWTGSENFDFCFCITFDCQFQTFINGSENGHKDVSLLKLNVFLIFSNFLICPKTLQSFKILWNRLQVYQYLHYFIFSIQTNVLTKEVHVYFPELLKVTEKLITKKNTEVCLPFKYLIIT